MTDEEYWDDIRRVVDTAPPLPPRVTQILRSGRAKATDRLTAPATERRAA